LFSLQNMSSFYFFGTPTARYVPRDLQDLINNNVYIPTRQVRTRIVEGNPHREEREAQNARQLRILNESLAKHKRNKLRNEILVRKKGRKSNRCCVCYERTQTQTKNCSHSLCIDCLSRWIREKVKLDLIPNCPTCRSDFYSD